MAEFETMSEFEKQVKEILRVAHTSAEIQDMSRDITELSRREIFRVLEKLEHSEVTFQNSGLIHKMIYMQDLRMLKRKYSPAPTYCEGMREMIESEYIFRADDGKFYPDNGEASEETVIKRCPFCKEGKNCIGESK